MRFVVCLLFFCLFLNAQKEIQITQDKNTLTLILPTTLPIKEEKGFLSYKFIIEDTLTSKAQTQILQDPFKEIDITTKDKQTFITLSLLTHNMIFSQKLVENQRVLTFQATPIYSFDWIKYLSVALILLGLIAFLIYIKRKMPKNSPTLFHFSQTYLDSRTKIITITSKDKIYLVLCNEKGNLLLDSYPKNPKENAKDFSAILQES